MLNLRMFQIVLVLIGEDLYQLMMTDDLPDILSEAERVTLIQQLVEPLETLLEERMLHNLIYSC